MAGLISTGDTIHIDQMTKRQLARLVNEYGERINQLQNYVRTCVNTLVAIVDEPDAVKRAGTKVLIEKAAIARVTKGTDLHFNEVEDQREVWTTPPAATPVVRVPTIVMPTQRM